MDAEAVNARRDALASEIVELRKSAEALYFAFDRLLNFGLIFIVGTYGVALTRDEPALLIFAPLPVSLLLLVFINLNTEGLSRAGHKKALEESLNTSIGSCCYVEEHYVAPTRQGNNRLGARGSVLGTQALVAFSLLIVVAVGGKVAYAERLLVGVTYTVMAVLVVGVLTKAALELRSSYRDGYCAATRNLRRPPSY